MGQKTGPFLNVDNFVTVRRLVVERRVICQKFANLQKDFLKVFTSCDFDLPFKLKIGIPLTHAMGNVFTGFDFFCISLYSCT